MEPSSKLPGPAVKRLQEALLAAFPTRTELAQMVRVGLDESLDAIVARENLRSTVFELIRWAEAHGRLGELIRAAQRANPGNPTLRAFTEERVQREQVLPGRSPLQTPGIQIEPTYENDEVRALAEQLDRARLRKKALEQAGASTTEVDLDILDLRRSLREGGQLRAGDALENDRYLLLKQIGRGGFGSVWAALDRDRGDQVALKVLHPDLAREPSRRERFFRGARVMAGLQHAAVVRVLNAHGVDGGYHYFVMELVDGEDLHHAVVGGRLPREEAVPLILRVGEALADAHAKGIVHRDVKPANILLDASRAPRLTDFDLVTAKDTTGGTRTGAMGTFLFTAPEQMKMAKDADARADVYGLGMTAIFCLHGADLPETAFRNPEAVIAELFCDKAIKHILTRAIEFNPSKRFADAKAFCEALRGTTGGRPPSLEARTTNGVDEQTKPATPQSDVVQMFSALAEGDVWLGAAERHGVTGLLAKAGSNERSYPWPFPGLEPFTEERAAFYFGRETEVAEATALLGGADGGHRRWLQIEGPSGAGKSSFARAGLVPSVRKGWIAGAPKAWRVAVIRPGTDPILSLAHGVHQALLQDKVSLNAELRAFHESDTALRGLLCEHTPPGHGFLLVIDQLEEAFTLAGGDRQALARFDALLASAITDKGGPLYLVTTIRSDFLGHFGKLPEMERLINAGAARYHLNPMSVPGLRAAIEEPAKLAGLVWESGLVDRILEDASASEGGLSLLAHVLAALWAHRRGNELSHMAYTELGGVRGALVKSADAIMGTLGNDERERARRMLLRLVKIGRGANDTRLRASRAEVVDAAGGGEEGERLLARLSGGRDPAKPATAGDVRIVVVSWQDGEARVELVHDVLLQQWMTLRMWIDEDRKRLELKQDLEAAAQVWEAAGRPKDGLPTGRQLAYLRSAESPGERAQQYLAAAELRERQRLRGQWMLAGAFVLIVLVVVSVVATLR